MADLDRLAMAMPETTKESTSDGRPIYRVHRKLFCLQRDLRKDAIDPETGEPMDDVLMFKVADEEVKEAWLADSRGIFFTTPHFDGYAAILIRIRDLGQIDADELHEMVAEAWLTRAQKRVAKGWLAENEVQN